MSTIEIKLANFMNNSRLYSKMKTEFYQTIVSTDLANLNSEKCYVVTVYCREK